MRELTTTEIDQVSGGGNPNWTEIGVGIGAIALGVAIVGTAGLATVPIGLVGAFTMGEIGIGITGLTLSFCGGGLMGHGSRLMQDV